MEKDMQSSRQIVGLLFDKNGYEIYQRVLAADGDRERAQERTAQIFSRLLGEMERGAAPQDEAALQQRLEVLTQQELSAFEDLAAIRSRIFAAAPAAPEANSPMPEPAAPQMSKQEQQLAHLQQRFAQLQQEPDPGTADDQVLGFVFDEPALTEITPEEANEPPHPVHITRPGSMAAMWSAQAASISSPHSTVAVFGSSGPSQPLDSTFSYERGTL